MIQAWELIVIYLLILFPAEVYSNPSTQYFFLIFFQVCKMLLDFRCHCFTFQRKRALNRWIIIKQTDRPIWNWLVQFDILSRPKVNIDDISYLWVPIDCFFCLPNQIKLSFPDLQQWSNFSLIELFTLFNFSILLHFHLLPVLFSCQSLLFLIQLSLIFVVLFLNCALFTNWVIKDWLIFFNFVWLWLTVGVFILLLNIICCFNSIQRIILDHWWFSNPF